MPNPEKLATHKLNFNGNLFRYCKNNKSIMFFSNIRNDWLKTSHFEGKPAEFLDDSNMFTKL